MAWSFFPSILFLNFPNILQRTHIAFIIGQKEQFYYFQKPELHCSFNVGIQPRSCSWTESVKGPWECSWAQQQRLVIYGNLPWGWPHHWNLFNIILACKTSRDLWTKTWRLKSRERHGLMRKLLGLRPQEVQCIHLDFASLFCDQFLRKDYFSHLNLLRDNNSHNGPGFFLFPGPEWEYKMLLLLDKQEWVIGGENSGDITWTERRDYS